MKKDPTFKKELKELSPLLSKLKKEEGYQVPFNYFENLVDEVMEQVTTKEPLVKAKSPSVSFDFGTWLLRLFQPRFALVFASLAILVVSSIYIIGNGDSGLGNETNNLLASITSEDASNYVKNHLDDFDLGLLAEDLDVPIDYDDIFDLDQMELQQYIEDQILDDFDASSLEELL